jgi:hypothetical protein
VLIPHFQELTAHFLALQALDDLDACNADMMSLKAAKLDMEQTAQHTEAKLQVELETAKINLDAHSTCLKQMEMEINGIEIPIGLRECGYMWPYLAVEYTFTEIMQLHHIWNVMQRSILCLAEFYQKKRGALLDKSTFHFIHAYPGNTCQHLLSEVCKVVSRMLQI